MNPLLFLKGILIGFSIAAPVGPIGVLCIRRTLTGGRKIGFASGLGAASADAIYGIVAGFGLSLVSNFLIDQQVILRLVGGIFLVYLGVKTFLSKTAEKPADAGNGKGLAGAYASTFFLTLTNPMTILSFTLIFAGLGLAESAGGNLWGAGLLVLGVFCGSALWWFLLSGGVSLLGQRLQNSHLVWINRAAGVIIFIFGMFTLWGLLPH